MTVYEAIQDMRRLSAAGGSFSFSFMSYSMSKGTSHGIVTVRKARLAKQSRTEKYQHADMMLNYIDLDTMEDKHCWQPLIIEFNEQTLTLDGPEV